MSDEMDTLLYLVRLWRGGPSNHSALRGKVQHVVTGAVGYFDGLSSLPQALETMMAQENAETTPVAERHGDETTSNSLQKEKQNMTETIPGEDLKAQPLTQASIEDSNGQVHGPGAAQLKELLTGEVLRPADPAYESSRKAWNTRFDRRPAIIVRCRTVEDVVRAVKGARQSNLPIAVRSGGHSMAGFGAIEGGLLVDLLPMDSLSINPDRRVATVEPGLTWGPYSERANQYGLATPAGDNATVGVGGLTLGGGIGWLARKYGMTVDHLLSAQVVTADGRGAQG